MKKWIILILICSVYASVSAQNIAFLQNPSVPGRQDVLIQSLKNEGYAVNTFYTPFDFTSLGGYDLVILGRAVSSGDFTDYASWNSLDVPVLMLNSYCLRNSRLRLINISSVVATADGSAVSSSLITSAVPVAGTDGTCDPVFNGIASSGVSFGYNKWFYDYINYSPADLITGSNTGKPLAILAGNASKGAGTLLMARWEPGKEAYPGSGVHQGYRTYINIGADDNAAPVHYNYENYTDASLKLFLNEVAFLTNKGEITAITAQPQSLTRNVGTSATFAVTATGTDLTYQWKKNGTDIAGATSSIYIIDKVVGGDAGKYTVVAAGTYGSPVTSDEAVLTVEGGRIAFLQNPVVPGNQNGLIQALNNEGYTVETFYTPFNFTTLGSYDLVILGRAVSSGDFTDYVRWNTLDVPVLVLNSYCIRNSRLRLINIGSVLQTAEGSTVSSSLITSAVPVAGADGTCDPVFNGIASEGVSFGYNKWFYDYITYRPADFVTGSNTGKPLVVLADNASKGAGTVLMARWEPGREAYPGSGINAGYRTYINTGADDNATPVKYNYESYTEAAIKLVLNEVAFLTSGNVPVSNCIGPSIQQQPESKSMTAGSSCEFSCMATGTGITYQWKKDGINIPGAASATYSLSSVGTGDAGDYCVDVNGECGSVTSSSVSLSICTIPAITSHPVSLTMSAGTSASFSVTATGTGISYQWKKNGADITGATSSTYTKTNLVSGDAGNYTVVVSGSCGSPLTSNVATLTVPVAAAINADFWVATNGSDSNPGTFDKPFATWHKGFNALTAGKTLCIRGGVYYANPVAFGSRYCGVVVDNKHGTSSAKYTVIAYPGEKPVLDCRNITGSYKRFGIYLNSCEYWHIKGLEITRVDQLTTGSCYIGIGMEINSGNHNTIENCVSHHNGGYGFGTRVDAHNTLFLNCDSYSNYDHYSATPGDDADGWDIGFASGNPVITLEGCRSWDNGDDGFDMYQGSGYSGIFYLKNCWAWHNGYRPDGVTSAGNGCGFKYGLDGQSYDGVARRYTYNCIAYDNRKRGYSQESANVKKVFYNNISYSNNTWGWSFYGFDMGDILRNNVAFGDGIEHLGSIRISDHNSWDGGVTVSSADFMSVDGTQLDDPRKIDGSLPDITFLKLVPGSDLIGAGVNVGLPFFGYHPDLGPFETLDNTKGAVAENKIIEEAEIDEVKESVRIYPNPVKDKLTVELNDQEKEVRLILFNSAGIKLYEGIGTGTSFIEMSSYPSGLYIVHVYGAQGEFRVMKIIK